MRIGILPNFIVEPYLQALCWIDLILRLIPIVDASIN